MLCIAYIHNAFRDTPRSGSVLYSKRCDEMLPVRYGLSDLMLAFIAFLKRSETESLCKCKANATHFNLKGHLFLILAYYWDFLIVSGVKNARHVFNQLLARLSLCLSAFVVLSDFLKSHKTHLFQQIRFR